MCGVSYIKSICLSFYSIHYTQVDVTHLWPLWINIVNNSNDTCLRRAVVVIESNLIECSNVTFRYTLSPSKVGRLTLSVFCHHEVTMTRIKNRARWKLSHYENTQLNTSVRNTLVFRLFTGICTPLFMSRSTKCLWIIVIGGGSWKNVKCKIIGKVGETNTVDFIVKSYNLLLARVYTRPANSLKLVILPRTRVKPN